MNKKLPLLNQSKSQKVNSSQAISPILKNISAFNHSKAFYNSPESEKINNEEALSQYSPSMLQKLSTRARLMKNKALLTEMGFRAELDFKPINLNESPKESSKLYSIKMIDFWGNKDKIKFLKKQGYWEAYKDMISESKKSKLYYSKSFKHPVPQKVLDITLKKKAQKPLEGSFSNSIQHKPINVAPSTIDCSLKTVESCDRLEKLEEIESKCIKLANDTKSLKNDANMFRSEISSKIDARDRKKNKLSRFEISKIKKNINSFRYP